MPSQAPDKPLITDPLGLGFGVVASLCTWVTPVMRNRHGKNSFGFHALFGLVLMMFWSAEYPCPELLYYIAFWLVCVLMQRIASLWHHHRGERQVTTYDGYPYLALILVPFVGEGTAKIVIEPAILCGAALAVATVSEGMGKFLMIAAAAIPIKHLFERRVATANDDAMADAQELMRQQGRRMRARR